MPNSLPQPALSWPQHPEIFLILSGVELAFYGMTLFRLRRVAYGADRRRFTAFFALAILVMFCGYYLMYGIAQPWESDLYQWMHQQGPNSLSLATLAVVTPSLDMARHLFLAGCIIFFMAPVPLPVLSAIWNARATRAQEAGGLVEASGA